MSFETSSQNLNKLFSVYFYNGGMTNNDPNFKIDKILDSSSDYHSSEETLGLNRSLILEYNGPKKFFTLENLRINR